MKNIDVVHVDVVVVLDVADGVVAATQQSLVMSFVCMRRRIEKD